MGDDVNLIEDNAGVEDVECRVIQGACKDDVFKKLKSVGMVDFPLNGDVAHYYRLMELGSVMEEVTVVGFVSREIWVICGSLSGRCVIIARKANILGCLRLQKICHPRECVHTLYDHSA